MEHAPETSASSILPLVIQLGFAGARDLFVASEHQRIDPEFTNYVTSAIATLLEQLPTELGLTKHQFFFCGISQIAIGADQAFAEACQRLGILHRIFLPQPLDGYLDANGSKGPDFSDEQRKRTQILLESKTIVQTRVVSDAPLRPDRFTDVNLEIVRVSDIVICLVRAGQDGAQGGTNELVQMAARRGRPTIVLEVSVGLDGRPEIRRSDNRIAEFIKPQWPMALSTREIAQLSANQLSDGKLPTGSAFAETLKNIGSVHANRLRFWFKSAALIIVVGHVMATIMATIALKLHHPVFTPALLSVELVLLTAGLRVHHSIHRAHSIARWAAFRLIAEVARSIRAIGEFPVYLEHFFALPFPPEFRPLLRTISVLHLHDTRNSQQEWTTCRNAYVASRLRDPSPKRGQIAYQKKTSDSASSQITLARRVFFGASFTALASTLLKLLLLCHCLPVPENWEEPLASILGALAIVLPTIAVAALSLAAAFDLEAKEHTSNEMRDFLEQQAVLLEEAVTEREFSRLVIETESRLLGETVNWYSRRFFVGVT